jgi:16S rRNA (cytosine1402-N4)-methyltransferase
MSSSTPEPAHVPVLLERCLGLLAPALTGPDAVVVDCTLGMGGHAEALLARTPARLVGLDRDPEALRRSAARLAPFGERVTLVHAVYDALPAVLADLGLRRVQGILFDLGVSSLQLDEAERGFSYAQDAPLDMRMDPTTGLSAAEVVNGYDGKALAKVLKEYGDERFASRIADAIVRERAKTPFTHGPSRRCASRSTTSSASCAAPSRRRSTPSPSEGGSSS